MTLMCCNCSVLGSLFAVKLIMLTMKMLRMYRSIYANKVRNPNALCGSLCLSVKQVKHLKVWSLEVCSLQFVNKPFNLGPSSRTFCWAMPEIEYVEQA